MQEHVHEDLKVMKKELDQWRDEYSKRNDVRIAAACESFVAVGGVHEYVRFGVVHIRQWLRN